MLFSLSSQKSKKQKDPNQHFWDSLAAIPKVKGTHSFSLFQGKNHDALRRWGSTEFGLHVHIET